MRHGIDRARDGIAGLALVAALLGLAGCGEGDARGPGREAGSAGAGRAAAATYACKVVGVTDGDTLRVLHDGREERIRLHGVDAPEKTQPYSTRAKQLVSSLAFGKVVQVQALDTDRYGRTVARIVLEDGRDLGRELVREGLAWWYRQYAADDAELGALEQDARAARRGLWADPSPQPPWEHRRQRKEAG